MAQRLKQQGYSSGCSVGDTIPYIICYEQVCHLVTLPIKGQIVQLWEIFCIEYLVYMLSQFVFLILCSALIRVVVQAVQLALLNVPDILMNLNEIKGPG